MTPDHELLSDDPLREESLSTAKRMVILLGGLCYLLGLGFTLAHSWNLLITPVAPEARWIAGIGVIALELNALVLPLALHYWTHTPAHRYAALAFYALDIFMLYANSNLDVQTLRAQAGLGSALAPWAVWYLENFAQVSPIYTIIVWAVLFSLDPTQVARERVRQLIAHAQLAALRSTGSWLQSEEFKRVIRRRGSEIGDHVLRQAFGQLPIPTDAEAPEPISDEERRAGDNGRPNFS